MLAEDHTPLFMIPNERTSLVSVNAGTKFSQKPDRRIKYGSTSTMAETSSVLSSENRSYPRVVRAKHQGQFQPGEQIPRYLRVSNGIRTTKYTIVTFLPKNLFEQFHRVANIYFLVLVILNYIPELNALQPELAMMPLIVVLLTTAVKDIFEDYRRYANDKEVNARQCSVYNRYVLHQSGTIPYIRKSE